MRHVRQRNAASTLALAVLLGVGLCPSAALGDRGAIVTVGEVDIEEPAQRAIIAHSGTREILILQTDVQADRETKVVEFMPLPSKPEVSLAPKECFAALGEIIKQHNVRYVERLRGNLADDAEAEAVKVVVAAQLGPHDVTVVEVKDAEAFVKWVEAFFEKKELGRPNLGNSLRDVVDDYLKRDLKFFAFDVVTLSPERKTVEPLAYEFACSRLYYPLKVTNLYGGTGTVELFTILPKWLHDCWGRHIRISSPGAQPVYFKAKAGPQTYRFLSSSEAELTSAETDRLHPGIGKLVGKDKAVLRAEKYEGPLKFDTDVWIGDAMHIYGPDGVCRRFLQAIETGDVALAESLVGVPFALDRTEVIQDKVALMAKLGEGIEKGRGRPLPVDAFEKWWPRQGKTALDMAGDELKLSDLARDFFLAHKARRVLYLARITVGDERMVFILDSNKIVGFED